MSRNTEASPIQPARQSDLSPAAATFAKDFALITTFGALIALCAILPAIRLAAIPTPITLQTFGVMLAGLILGPARGALAATVYLLMGAVGLPVFSGGAAGFAVFLGPTAGYLVSFPLLAAAVGALARLFTRHSKSLRANGSTQIDAPTTPRAPRTAQLLLLVVLSLAASYAITHALGILGMAWRVPMSLRDAFVADAIFLPGDAIKTTCAVVVAGSLWRAFPALKQGL